jgi:hypothetical protein
MEIAGEFIKVETGKRADALENAHICPPPFARLSSSGLTLRCPNWIACREMYISFRVTH